MLNKDIEKQLQNQLGCACEAYNPKYRTTNIEVKIRNGVTLIVFYERTCKQCDNKILVVKSMDLDPLDPYI